MPTSEEWLKTLGKTLDARYWRLKRYDNYYRGDHSLAFSTSKYREAFGRLFAASPNNFMTLVVDSVEERLDVDGFRIGDEQGDEDAWRIWQDNQLDAESQLAHTEALIKEQSYALVWGNGEQAQITIEDPLQMVVAFSAGNRRIRRAAMKRWIDDSGFLFATLYLPDRIEKYQSQKKVDATSLYTTEAVQWERREVSGEAWPLRNPLGVVPVVPFINSPRLDGTGMSEIAEAISIQDKVNKLAADMMIAAEFGAFRQRWVTGIDIPEDPETGEPIDPFPSAVHRMFYSEKNETQFGEFGQTDLAPYVNAIGMHIQHIASITRTPPHYFLASMGNFPSGEALKSAETGLVSKARRKMRHFGESWEEVIRLAFRVTDNPKGEITNSETIWRNPESRSLAEVTDAVIKKFRAGLIPWEAALEEAGATQRQIKDYKRMRMQDALEVAGAFDPFREISAGATAES